MLLAIWAHKCVLGWQRIKNLFQCPADLPSASLSTIKFLDELVRYYHGRQENGAAVKPACQPTETAPSTGSNDSEGDVTDDEV